MSDAYPWVGRDFLDPGWTCWDLVRSTYADLYGLHLPLYDTVGPHDALGKGHAFREATSPAGDWVEVPLAEARLHDAVLMSQRAIPVHVGLYMHVRRVLHVAEGMTTAIQPLEMVRHRFRVVGVYRHRSLEAGFSPP